MDVLFDVRFKEASIRTAENLKTIAQSQLLREHSRLTLMEIEATTNLISQVIPAGNVPGIILSGLARLTGHRPPISTIKLDVDLLFQSVEQVLDKAVYATIFFGSIVSAWLFSLYRELYARIQELPEQRRTRLTE